MKLFVVFLMCVACSGFFYSVSRGGEETCQNSTLENLEFERTPLKHAIDLISNKSSCRITIDSDLLLLPVTGRFSDISVVEFLNRVLRKENVLIVFSGQNDIVVRGFGKKNFALYTTGMEERVDISPLITDQENARTSTKGDIDYEGYEAVEPITGVSLRQIKDQQDQDDEQYKEYIQDPEAVEPLTGMKIADIRALHAQEDELNKHKIAEGVAVEPITGMKLNDIKSLRSYEKKVYKEYLHNPDSVEPITGKKLTDISALSGNY